MRVIITGGTGLIGRQLAADLQHHQHEVIVLSRSQQRPSNLPAGVRLAPWDGHTATGWSQWVDGDTAIVNLAGASIAAGRWTRQRKLEIASSRVDAGKAVVEAVEVAAVKPRVVIQASAVGYYGPCGDEVITEASPPGSDFLATVCIQWENATAPVAALGVRHVVIRTGIVLSNEGGALPKILLPFRFFAGGKIGSGRQRFPWIHIADEVEAIRFLIEHPTASGPFNLAAPNPPTGAQFTKAIGKALGRPTLVPAPGIALRTLFGEMSTVLLDGQRAEPQHLLQLGYQFRFIDPVVALKELLR